MNDDDWLHYATGEIPAIGDIVTFLDEEALEKSPVTLILSTQKRICGHGWFGAPYLMSLVRRGKP